MMKEKINVLKNLLKIMLKTNSIKITNDGKIEIVFKFKPNECKVNSNIVKELEEKVLSKIRVITKIKYRITTLQKEPNFCYNTYARVLSISSSTSKDRVKRFLKYFIKMDNNKFVLTSYSDIKIILQPPNKEDFQNFLLTQQDNNSCE